jgi:hypothetical protein
MKIKLVVLNLLLVLLANNFATSHGELYISFVNSDTLATFTPCSLTVISRS